MSTHSPAKSTLGGAAFEDEESNYGSDFSPEEEQLLAQILTVQSTSEDNPITSPVEHYEPQRKLRLPRVLGREGREGRSALFEAAKAADEVAEQINESVSGGDTYLDLSKQLKGTKPLPPHTVENGGKKTTEAKPPDTRSPLERFRTPPRKGLSVTDLISPAWCELQYWYTLTLHGRKKRTPAMKQGSRVHQVLEDQVHTTVEVEVKTIEDRWGLRIWNSIQGLQSLRTCGQTRELEVWGTIDGLVVNGVIDELSYICPDADLEETLERPPESPNSNSKNEVPPDQATISEFFKAAKGTSPKATSRAKRRTQTNKIYLCDVKTRGVKSLPTEVAFRPTRMQLMLYHHLFSALATEAVDFSVFSDRYKLDPDKPFSDAFIAQVGSLNDEFLDAQTSPDPSQDSLPSSQNSLDVLLQHNSLGTLWALMIKEFQTTIPDGASSLGKVLKAEYRSRGEGEVLGSKTFAMDEKELKSYLEHEMAWWKGERKAEGVAIEEAFKCRTCEFAETCEWRLEKVEEATHKWRAKRKQSVDA